MGSVGGHTDGGFAVHQTQAPPIRSPWRDLAVRTLVLVAVAAALAGVLAVLGFGVVGTHGGGAIQGWDDTVGGWFLHHRGGLIGGSKVIAFLGDAGVLAVITVVVTGALFLVGHRTRAFIPLVAYLGGEFLVYLTRVYIHRPRPSTANAPAPGAIPGIHETSASFPSGHATAATAVLASVAALAVITWKIWWPWIVGAVLVLAVAGSRLILGVHWFSDVTFGLIVGVVWGITVAYVLADAPWPFAHADRHASALGAPDG
jgi:undecaprenyl-diphosphatase